MTSELNVHLPRGLVEYLTTAVPLDDVDLRTEGNAIRLWGIHRLGGRQDGYSYNPLLQQDIEDWDRNLLVIADEGGDPYVVELSGSARIRSRSSPRSTGAEVWEIWPASSLATFLVLSAAKHRELEMGDTTRDYESGRSLPARSRAALARRRLGRVKTSNVGSEQPRTALFNPRCSSRSPER